jgi:hypothetical protein
MRVLQWLEGLKRLGHDILYYENCDGKPRVTQAFADIMTRWWEPGRSAKVLPSGKPSYGLDAQQVEAFGREAAAIIFLGAQFVSEPVPWLANIHPRVLIEQDPGFTHIWAEILSPDTIFGRHDKYFTVGANVGTQRCSLPTFGYDWQPIWNPVVIDWWDPGAPIEHNHFTTVASWWGKKYLEFDGKVFGPKVEEMKKFIDLPTRIQEEVKIVIDTFTQDPTVVNFEKRGWIFQTPTEATNDMDAYREYINGSAGEFSCVKGLYAGSRCGWFSDRSACYLAAGRPVVVQETGFSDLLPVGNGLIAVETVEEAAEAIRAIRLDYRLHGRAAREIAVQEFESTRVLTRLLELVGVN